MLNNATVATDQFNGQSTEPATILLMLIIFVLTARVAHAQDHAGQVKAIAIDTRASYATCLTAASGATPDMKQCMGAEYSYQDKRLNKAYKSLMATLGKDQQTKLRSDERRWIAYRDAHCSLDPNGGQAAELDAYDCSVQETAKQAGTLEDRLHQTH